MRMNSRIFAYMDDENDGNTMTQLDKFELPLWAGYLPISFPDEDGVDQTTTFKVTVTTANSTWQPILLSEWAKINKVYGLGLSPCTGQPTLRPCPRRATPLPPLARIKSFTGENLERLSRYLYQSDQIIEIDVPKGNRILIMNRLQACARLRTSSIWQYYLKERREIVDEETWSLAFWGEDLPHRLTRIIRDPFSEEPGYMFQTQYDGDLFAFTEPTDESNDDAGEAQVIEMARNIRGLLQQYKVSQDLRIERLQQQIMGISLTFDSLSQR